MKRAKLTQKAELVPDVLRDNLAPTRFVLDYLSQNGSNRYHFDLSKI